MDSCDEVDCLIDAQPSRQHGDVGDEAGVVHEIGALGERLTAQDLEPAYVSGQAENGAQCGGFSGAVRADEPDDAA